MGHHQSHRFGQRVTLVSKHQCVGALIVQQESILLGLRSPTRVFYPNVWDIFGGHIEPGEQPEQTLVRELHEELGITAMRWRHVETLQLAQDYHEKIHFEIFLLLEWGGTAVNRQPDEHAIISWFRISQAVQLPLADPSYPEIFIRALQP